jgi:hypothetical protein
MKQKKQKPTPTYAEPEAARRKLAAAYRQRAEDKNLTRDEKAEFLRMAELWQKTLPRKL